MLNRLQAELERKKSALVGIKKNMEILCEEFVKNKEIELSEEGKLSIRKKMTLFHNNIVRIIENIDADYISKVGKNESLYKLLLEIEQLKIGLYALFGKIFFALEEDPAVMEKIENIFRELFPENELQAELETKKLVLVEIKKNMEILCEKFVKNKKIQLSIEEKIQLSIEEKLLIKNKMTLFHNNIVCIIENIDADYISKVGKNESLYKLLSEIEQLKIGLYALFGEIFFALEEDPVAMEKIKNIFEKLFPENDMKSI